MCRRRAFPNRTVGDSVDGDSLALDLIGTANDTLGNCTFTNNWFIRANIDGDTLSGRVEYRAATNDNPDCAPIEGCLTYQEFNGARPPT